MEWYIYLLVIAAGALAGFINTLAGNGSLITLPLLIFLGLPANVANGTNRVAILMQTATSVTRYRKTGQLNVRHGLILSIPAVIGAVLGAQIAVSINEQLLRLIIGVLMVAMLALLFARPKRWLQGREEAISQKPGIGQMVALFFVGMYGGFIQVGVGVFLLAALVLGVGYGLKGMANPIKNLIVFCFTILALLIFVLNDQVEWVIGIILGLGNMVGAWIAVKVPAEKYANHIRWLLIVMVAASAIKLLGVWDFLIDQAG